MSLEYINKTYNLNVRLKDIVTYTGNNTPVRMVVVGARDAHLLLRPVDKRKAKPSLYHPTWELQYQ